MRLNKVVYNSCYGNDYYKFLETIFYVVNRYHYEKFIDIREIYYDWRGWHPRWQVNVSWVYPPLATEMMESGLGEVYMYVTHHQNTVELLIVTRPIIDLCLATERLPGVQVFQRWWVQVNLYLQEVWAVERAAEMEEHNK